MIPKMMRAAVVQTAKLEDINQVFEDMKKGDITGRVVLQIANPY
ncbi:hypothetical protein [Mucilaginibacter sp.]